MDEHTRQILTILDEDGRQLHLLFVRLTLREDVAEDLMQELFLKLHNSPGFRRADHPGAFARRAALHLAFDWRRRQQRRVDAGVLDVEPETEQPSSLQRLVDREETEQILLAVDRLPKLTRDCFLLRYLQNEPYQTVAQQCGKTPHQARALCHKAIVRLRKLLHVGSDQDSSAEVCHET